MEYNKELTNSERRIVWAKRFIENLENKLKTGNKEITIDKRYKEGEKSEYIVLRENLQDILNYVKHLMTDEMVKPLSASVEANYLIYFADFVRKPFKEVTKEDIEKFFEKYKDHSEAYNCTFRRIIKPFFRWIYKYEKEDGYPPIVKWIKCGRRVRRLPNILTMKEIQKMIEVCDNLRNRAIISVLYESGFRASELMDLKIKDLNFDEYGAILMVNGKTGMRRTRLISSITDLKAWLNVHKNKNDVNAPLFCTFTKNKYGSPVTYPLTSSGLSIIIGSILKRTNIEKRVYPHIFRHTRATHLAKHLTEQELKAYFGWTQNSGMASIYVHLSGQDMDDKILQIYGVKPIDGTQTPKIPTIKCPKCSEINSIGNMWCWKCDSPLGVKEITEAERATKFIVKLLPTLMELAKNREISINDLEEIIKPLGKPSKSEESKEVR